MYIPAATVGQTVRILETQYEEYNYLEGAEITLERDASPHSIHVPGKGWITVMKWEIVPPVELEHRYTMPDSMADMEAEIARLRIDLATAQRDRDFLQTQNKNLWADLGTVNNALLQEADERDWCDEYETFVNAVNERMTAFYLDLPTIDFEVRVQRVRTIYEETTVIVSGRRGSTEYDLQDAVYDAASMSYDWTEYDDDVSDEYEITDVSEA